MRKICFVIIGIALLVFMGTSAVFADDFLCLTPYGDMEGDIAGCSVGKNAAVVKEKGAAAKSSIDNHFLTVEKKSSQGDFYCSFAVQLKKGHKYCYSFDYCAKTPQTMWLTTGHSFWASSSWQSRLIEFTASDDADEIVLYAVKSSSGIVDSFSIDNFFVYDITDCQTINIAEYNGAKIEILSGAGDRYGFKQKYAYEGSTVRFKVECTDSSSYCESVVVNPGENRLKPDAEGVYKFVVGNCDVTVEAYAMETITLKRVLSKTYAKFLKPGTYGILAAEYINGCLSNTGFTKITTKTGNEEIVLNEIEELSNIAQWDNAVIFTFDGNNFESLKPLREKYVTGIYYDKYNENNNEWHPAPMVSKEYLATGNTGGEGCQILKAMSISSDGSFLVAGTDVAGLLRSFDGGANWQKTGVGFYAEGCTGLEIDPNNKNVVIGVSDYSSTNGVSGVYISFDAAENWTQVVSTNFTDSNRDPSWRTIVFDPSSYDEKLGRSRVIYWSARARTDGNKDGAAYGLWRSDDGGITFNIVNENMSNCMIRVHPTNGTLYAAALDGVYRSTDKGKTFEKVLDGIYFRGIDVVSAAPDNVYVNNSSGVWRSVDCGRSFEKISDNTYPTGVTENDTYNMTRNISVSPVNPQKMVLCWFSHANYSSVKYYSHNGGVTWSKAADENDNNFYNINNRHSVFVWSPAEENTVFGFGGDYVAKSTDAGKHYYYSFNGGNLSCLLQRNHFNVYNPDIICIGNQDYDGAYTTDGGESWKSICMQNGSKYTGAVYGSYAADENTVIVLGSTHLNEDGSPATSWNATVEIRISRDGGGTWQKTGIILPPIQQVQWKQSCTQSANDKNILFASNMRSVDFGYSWAEMNGCEAVITHNPYGNKELYGINKGDIVVSFDEGATWQIFYELSGGISQNNSYLTDLSYDGINNIMYYAGEVGFGKIQNGILTDLTKNLHSSDCCGGSRVCAVDPRYPDVIYVGSTRNKCVNNYGIQRSVDGGKSFQVLTRGNEKGKKSFTGTFCGGSIVSSGMLAGVDVCDILVHPHTGEVWITDGCRGLNKFAPPYKEKGGQLISFENAENINFENLSFKNGNNFLEGISFDDNFSALCINVNWKNVPRLLVENVNVNADKYKNMEISYMYSGCYNGDALLSFGSDYAQTLYSVSDKEPGRWYKETYDFSENNEWKGNITGFNLHLCQSESISKNFKYYIRYIRFY